MASRVTRYAFEDPAQLEIAVLIQALDTLQRSLYPPQSNHLLDISALQDLSVRFLVARENDIAIGCGAVKFDPRGWGEIKRMYVVPAARRQGIGAEILRRLEEIAVGEGISKLLLETGIDSVEALKAYERSGYVRRGPFGDYKPDPLSVFMEKVLVLN